MSRIGKKPVPLPQGVSASISGQSVEVKGPKGTRSFHATDDVTLTMEDGAVKVTPRGTSKRARQQWGMVRSQVENLVTGVTTGFKKELEIQGVGYRAAITGNVLKLSLGYSHDVLFDVPEHDQEGRVLTAEYADFFLVNVYVPNSKRELTRLAYRQQWDRDFLRHLKKLERTSKKLLMSISSTHAY